MNFLVMVQGYTQACARLGNVVRRRPHVRAEHELGTGQRNGRRDRVGPMVTTAGFRHPRKFGVRMPRYFCEISSILPGRPAVTLVVRPRTA